MSAPTLVSLFERDKQRLEEQLKRLVLPKDSKKIKQIVSTYLNEIFDSENDFRQNLTQAEDYILQASLSLLNAQQAMVQKIDISSLQPSKSMDSPLVTNSSGLKKEMYPHVVIGTSLGAGAGGLLLGTWGAVFGAIAGTAVVLYYASRQTNIRTTPTIYSSIPITDQISLDTEAFLSIVRNLCSSVDSLIDTFRAQINRVINKYESLEKPTLEKEYRSLLEGIQSLIGYKRAHKEDEKFLRKIQERIEDIAEVLDNYNLTVEDYTEEHKNWFDLIENPNTTELAQVLPAIVKNKNVVLKGRVFIPETLK